MLTKITIIISIVLYTLSLSAYEPPKINLANDGKPKIVLFTSENILVNKELSYKISWKTINATHVQISYLGNVDLSGSVTVTEDEYKKGPITLTAISTKNSFTDSKTINKSLQAEREAPIIIREEKSNHNTGAPLPYYNNYNRGYRAPLRRIRR